MKTKTVKKEVKKFVRQAAENKKPIADSKSKHDAKSKPAINPSLAYCPKMFGKVLDKGNFICIEGFKKGITKETLLNTLMKELPPMPSNEFMAAKPDAKTLAKEKARINNNRLYKAIWRLKQIGTIVTVKNGIYKI